MARPWIVPDFETASACDLKKAGADRYAADPTTEVICLSWETHHGHRGTWYPDLGDAMPDDIHDALHGGWTFVAHNAGFERAIWRHIMTAVFGWEDIPLGQWADTSARALQLALPAGLDNVLRALKLPQEKDKEGNKLTLALSRANRKGYYPVRTPAMMQRIYAYCESDIAGQVSVHRRLGWLPPAEREIWEISQEINDRGIPLDMDFVRSAQLIVDKATGPLASEFKEITGGLTFTQVAKVKAWVQDQGVPLDNLRKETLDQLLGSEEAEDDDLEPVDEWDEPEPLPELPPNVHRALSIRQLVGSASVKKLRAMTKCVGFDNRARGTFVYHGTTPGRQTARLFQPHNFPRGTVKHDVEEIVALIKTGSPEALEARYGPAVEAVVSSLRHAICAPAGHTLMAGDYSGIQLRTLLALAGQHDKCDLLAAGLNAYCDMGFQIYGRVIDKTENVQEYTISKNAVLGLGFQMGPPKFHLKYSMGQPLSFCERVVNVYRQDWAPLVPELWRGLQRAAIDTVWYETPHEHRGITYFLRDDWLVARIQNGSEIHYAMPRKTRRAMPWDETDVRRGFSYSVQKQGRWIQRDAFGGQLTENAVMKIEREIMEAAKKRLKAAGIPVIMEVHDELVAQILAGQIPLDEYTGMMEDVDQWDRDLGIPVAVEAWEGPRYRK